MKSSRVPALSHPSHSYSFFPRINNKKAQLICPRTARGFRPQRLDSPSVEFAQPEYLEQQINTIKREISILKSENQVLSDELEKTQEKFLPDDGSTVTKHEEYNPEKWLSSQLAHLRSDYDALMANHARLRRLFADRNMVQLSNDIEYQRNLLSDLVAVYNEIIEQQKAFEEEYKEQMGTGIANLIQGQRRQIDRLKKEFEELNSEEQKMIDKYMEIVNDVPKVTIFENKLKKKKRKLEQVEHNKMRLGTDLRRIRREFRERIADLEREIYVREKSIREKEEKGNWKSVLNCGKRAPISSKSEVDMLNRRRVSFDSSLISGLGIPSKSAELTRLFEINNNNDEMEEDEHMEDLGIHAESIHIHDDAIDTDYDEISSEENN